MISQASINTGVDINEYLADLILSDLIEVVDKRQLGHCMQVTDLPFGLMESLCKRLRESRPQCEAYVLNPNPLESWHVTSTKLVERRNAEESVIVVFLPPDLHTSAEDSFDISTFERFPISNLYYRLREKLLGELPKEIRVQANDVIRESECKDEVAVCRYLLSIYESNDQGEGIGLNLHHLGLIPDAALLDIPEVLRPQLKRNLKSVQILSSPNDALFAKIQRLELNEGKTPKDLYRFFDRLGIFDQRTWLPVVLSEEYIDDLTFDKWDFREKVTGDIEDIVITDLGSTGTNDDGYPLFNIQQDKHLKVAWETTPPPVQCNDLSSFTIEIMQDGVPVTEARTVQAGRSKSKSKRTTLKSLDKLDLDEGLYYLRVSAWASGSSLLHSVDSESIFFKGGVEAGDDDEDEVPTRRQRQTAVSCAYEAMLRTQVSLRGKDQTLDELIAALKKRGKRVEMNWFTPERRSGGRYTDQFTIKYNSANQYTLPVNTILRRIEEETLADADSLGRWELDLTKPVTAEIQPILQAFEGIEYDDLDDFLLIRKELFQRILNQPDYSDVPFLVETSNLEAWETEIVQYAESYQLVLDRLAERVEVATNEAERSRILFDNRQITSIDCVRLLLQGEQEAYLLSPTHPLKMLWALQYARVTRQWIDEIDDVPKSQVSWSTFDRFLPKLSSLNIPNAIVSSSGQLLVNVDGFGPFWTIFVPLEVDDVRAMIGRIKALLGSPEADETFTTISGVDLAGMIQRYLKQHPYVTSLRVNAVQPGSGAILVEMLLELEKRRPDLRYHLHLFSADFQPEELGHALDELMSPSEKRSGREELDAFLTASQNALFPKLTYSKHDLENLLSEPETYEAHVTFLFDAFKVKVQTQAPVANSRSNHLFGLLHEYVEEFSSEEGNISWRRQIVPGEGLDLEGDKPVHTTMVDLFKRFNELTAAIASEGKCLNCTPTLHLPLGPAAKNLVNQVHQISDWVFTIDRNFGLDYLDNPYDAHCPAYLIDYQPEYLGDVGHRLVISTQQIAEIDRIVRPVLQRLELPSRPEEANSLVNALRSISGRLVLKLISSPQMAHGALGMALARLFLESAELLNDMVLIPLDTHTELFATARKEAERLGQELSLQRTDLLLVEIAPTSDVMTFHLVEVKFRQDGALSSGLEMKEQIARQLNSSFDTLRHLYDPNYTVPDRFDRLIRTRELSALLTFYLERAVRYKLVSEDQLKAMQQALNRLERGYALQFKRHGVVFRLGDEGYETEEDGEVTYHYLGSDKIVELMQSAVDADATNKTLSPDSDFTSTRALFTRRPRRRIPRDEVEEEQQHIKEDHETLAELELEIETPETKETSIEPGKQKDSPEEIAVASAQVSCDVLLGAKHPTPQFGLLGRTTGQTVGLDLNGTNTISLFGVQGSGKSYTLGTILEMSLMNISGINKLVQPLASVVFHYSKTEDYKPEFASLINPNTGDEVSTLRDLYNAKPKGVQDLLVLVPAGKIEQRRKEFPDLEVAPIAFDSSELDIEDWKFLMGVMGSDAMYVKKMNQVLRKIRNRLSLDNLYTTIAGSRLSDAQIELAQSRLEFVQEYISDGQFLRSHIRPGRLIVVDLRDEFIEQDEALGLFMVMLKIFANAHYDGRPFSKLVVFDEAHKYMNSSFINEVTSVVREMRHKATSVLIASQDPKSVPLSIIELSSQIILHRFSSPAWLKHIQKGAVALQDLTAGRLNMLGKGQAYVWSREATQHEFETRAVKVDIRPRVTKHGGETIKAI